jgi:uncharacterized protein VirK/YbjX
MPSIQRYFDVARTVHKDRGKSNTFRLLVFAGRSLLAAPYSDEWYAQLAKPPFAEAAASNPSLYRKIVRPYLTCRTSDAEKLRILREHCALLSSVLDARSVVRAFSSEGIPLARIVGRDGRHFSVFLLSDGKYRKEGEHSLVLVDGDTGVRISTMTFVTDRDGGGRTMLIGGMQGLPKGVDKSVISASTRALHSMRPKALLLFGLRTVARAWRIDNLRAIGNAVHVSRHHDYALNRIRRPRLNYDDFWIESGGEMRDDGFIDLPLAPPLRDDRHIPTGKRATYHRRYEMLSGVAYAIRVTLDTLRPQLEVSS